jgi:hypothetical protein
MRLKPPNNKPSGNNLIINKKHEIKTIKGKKRKRQHKKEERKREGKS